MQVVKPETWMELTPSSVQATSPPSRHDLFLRKGNIARDRETSPRISKDYPLVNVYITISMAILNSKLLVVQRVYISSYF
jgi:hypothetical protein